MMTRIREAFREDYPSIFQLIQRELGYETLDYQKLCTRLDSMCADNSYLTIVAEAEGFVVGFLGLRRGIAYNLEDEYIQITALAVSVNFQKRGIGKQLMAWAETYGRQNAIHKLTLNSSMHRSTAHTFYEEYGYKKSSYAFYKEI